MKGIVIGAGRGIRMMPHTESCPKCMIEVGGRRVLDWILDSLLQAEIDDITFIGGYHIDKVRQEYPHLRFYNNADWLNNNILESLFCAEPELSTEFVVTYSDIIFAPSVVQQLATFEAEIGLVVDLDWKNHYEGRSSHPESEAEKVVVEDEHVIRIGKRLSSDQTYGEFIGLAKFSQSASHSMCAHYRGIHDYYLTSPFHEAQNIRKAYLTDLLQELINLGIRVEPMGIRGNWMELDTPQDLEYIHQWLINRDRV